MKTILEYLQSGHLSKELDYVDSEHISKELDYVDLGLPSGTLWAKMNIGATEGKNPKDWYGLYFAWGETHGYKASNKHVFNWNTYKFGTDDNLLKYNKLDKLKKLADEDDAAYQNTNGKFRMPTDKELEELLKYTEQKWVKDYNRIKGLNGKLFTSKQDKTKYIFIPASGGCGGSSIYSGDYFELWGSIINSVNPSSAYGLCTNAGNIDIYSSERFCGYAVRGVLLNK